jgi:hypothetical protein
MTWMATRSPDEIKAMQDYGAAMRALFRALQDLREKRIEAAAPEVQALITEWNALAVRYGLRRMTVCGPTSARRSRPPRGIRRSDELSTRPRSSWIAKWIRPRHLPWH